MFSSRITESKCKRVKDATWSNRSILFLNRTSGLFIRQAIESKIHWCTLLNLSPHCTFTLITLILAVPFLLCRGQIRELRFSTKVVNGSAAL